MFIYGEILGTGGEHFHNQSTGMRRCVEPTLKLRAPGTYSHARGKIPPTTRGVVIFLICRHHPGTYSHARGKIPPTTRGVVIFLTLCMSPRHRRHLHRGVCYREQKTNRLVNSTNACWKLEIFGGHRCSAAWPVSYRALSAPSSEQFERSLRLLIERPSRFFFPQSCTSDLFSVFADRKTELRCERNFELHTNEI